MIPEDQEEGCKQAAARRRKRGLKQRKRSVWMGMGMFGLIGSSIALPPLVGLFLGLWLDGRTETNFSWAFALMAGGLTLGLVNVWGWMQKAAKEGDEDDGK